MKNLTRIIIGAILIACGTVYILGAFGITNINFLFDGWWTLFIIIPCLNGLFTSKDKFGNFIDLAVGVLLLLAAQDVFEYDMVWKIIVPIIFIMLGVKLIVKSISQQYEIKNTEKNKRKRKNE